MVERHAVMEFDSAAMEGAFLPHSLYVNRELSWLQFNRRVLEEALDETHPLLERVKFLSIFASNLDEFFMVRVAGLLRQVESGALELPPDGLTPAEQLQAIREALLPSLAEHMRCWTEELRPLLEQQHIRIRALDDLTGQQRAALRAYFAREIFPVLTPLALDPGHPFPHISNLSLNLAIVVHDAVHGERFARLKIPPVFPRLTRVVLETPADRDEFVWLEDVIKDNLDLLFPGLEISDAYPFRVTRDADLEINEDEASDLLTTVEEMLSMRYFGSVIRLEVSGEMPEQMRQILMQQMDLAAHQLYVASGPLGMRDLMGLMEIDRPALKDTPFLPSLPPALQRGENIFSVLRRNTLLSYPPYDSFTPVVDFVAEAARDPQVLAVKQTLYRVGKNSPIVAALMEARQNGKQVAVLVELKARFDEEYNIGWARALERAGVHVVYGVPGLKTHAKVCLVVRREPDGIVRYVHMATGNYNAVTARIYTDLGYFTTDPVIADDVSRFFNAITGYSCRDEYAKLLVAPGSMRKQILERIEREIQRQRSHGDGYLAFKMNQLVDKPCIRALYRASQAGVKVDLQVRGICCLRPQVAGVSENITVTSIVGRFLEHARIFYFRNGGQEEILLGSADMMPRNLDRRVELVFPVQDLATLAACREILFAHLRDNVKARHMLADGSYARVLAQPGEQSLNSQTWLLEHRGAWHQQQVGAGFDWTKKVDQGEPWPDDD
jgi:polyphosphate kinase